VGNISLSSKSVCLLSSTFPSLGRATRDEVNVWPLAEKSCAQQTAATPSPSISTILFTLPFFHGVQKNLTLKEKRLTIE
jgi:hypothetical protein